MVLTQIVCVVRSLKDGVLFELTYVIQYPSESLFDLHTYPTSLPFVFESWKRYCCIHRYGTPMTEIREVNC